MKNLDHIIALPCAFLSISDRHVIVAAFFDFSVFVPCEKLLIPLCRFAKVLLSGTPPPHPVDTRARPETPQTHSGRVGHAPSVENRAFDELQKVEMATRNGSGAEASGVSPFLPLIEVTESYRLTRTLQLVNTLQGHVDDIRTLIQCGICIRPLYEPFTIACGHTFCYSVSPFYFTSSLIPLPDQNSSHSVYHHGLQVEDQNERVRIVEHPSKLNQHQLIW